MVGYDNVYMCTQTDTLLSYSIVRWACLGSISAVWWTYGSGSLVRKVGV